MRGRERRKEGARTKEGRKEEERQEGRNMQTCSQHT